jgi:hypothetical protein
MADMMSGVSAGMPGGQVPVTGARGKGGAKAFAPTAKKATAGKSQGARHVPHPFGKTVSKPAATTPTARVPVASVRKFGGAAGAPKGTGKLAVSKAPQQTGNRAANAKLGKANGARFGGY